MDEVLKEYGMRLLVNEETGGENAAGLDHWRD